MNVNLNTIHQASASPMLDEIAPSGQKPPAEQAAALSITHAALSPDEIAGAEVSEKDLARNDPLGQFVTMAFNLPPPPFPVLPDS